MVLLIINDNIYDTRLLINLPRSRITIREVTHELFIHHASWCPKGSLKKFIETFSWHFYAGKLKTEQKVIILPCLHSLPYLFSRKISTQSHSAKFLNWGDHVNSVPDLTASSPAAEHQCKYGTQNTCLQIFFSFWTQISFSVISKVFLTTSVFHFLKLEYLFEEIYASQLFYQRLETPP